MKVTATRPSEVPPPPGICEPAGLDLVRRALAELEALRGERETLGSLAAEVAALKAETAKVAGMLRQWALPMTAIDAMAREDERALIFAGKRHRPRRARPGHLSAVPDGRPS